MLGLKTLFGKVREVELQRQTERSRTYRELLEALADGDTPDVDEVLSIIDVAGRSADQLEADVQLTLQRREWTAQAERAHELFERHNELTAEIDGTQAEFERQIAAVRQNFERQLQDLHGQLAKVSAGRDEAQTARNKLLETSGKFREICNLQAARGKLLRPVEIGSDLYNRREKILAGVTILRRRVAAFEANFDKAKLATIDPASELGRLKSQLSREEALLRAVDGEIAEKQRQAAAISEKLETVTAEALAV